MSKKKLYQIVDSLNHGSVGKIAESIGAAAISHGWESIIAFGRSYNKSSSISYRIGNRFDVYRHVIGARLFGINGLCSTSATKNLIVNIKNNSPDLIHLHNLHGYFLNYEILFNFLADSKIPVVWTLHDCWSFTGHCAHFDFINCNKWENECFSCPQLGDYPKTYIDRSRFHFLKKKELYDKMDKRLTIVSVSKWMDSLLSYSILRKFNHLQIYSGIDLNVFKPKVDYIGFYDKYPQYRNKRLFLSVSSQWIQKKGFFDLLSFSKLLKPDELLILIGPLSKIDFELSENLVVINYIESSELIEYYSHADVYLNLSYEESFGLTSIEAMSCGTPVVAYDSTALKESIDFNTGISVPKGNLIEIRGAIDLILYRHKTHDYFSHCIKRVKELFCRQSSSDSYINLFELILKNNSNEVSDL
jgi:glycosyltransferase involved in cell wall biosynthesis